MEFTKEELQSIKTLISRANITVAEAQTVVYLMDKLNKIIEVEENGDVDGADKK